MVETRKQRLISRFEGLTTGISLQLNDDLAPVDEILAAAEHDADQWARFRESHAETYQRASDLAVQLVALSIQEAAQAKRSGTDGAAIGEVLDEWFLGKQALEYFHRRRDIAGAGLRELGFTEDLTEDLLSGIYDRLPEALRGIVEELISPLIIVSPVQAGTFISILVEMFRDGGAS
jgi:hypothetical protein